MNDTARSYLDTYNWLEIPLKNPHKWHWGGLRIDEIHLKKFERVTEQYSEIIVCINIGGQIELRCGSQYVKLGHESVVVCPAYEEVAWGMGKPGRSISILIKPEYFNEVATGILKVELDAISSPIMLAKRMHHRNPSIARLGYELFERSHATGFVARASMDTLTKALVAALVRDYSEGHRNDDESTLSPSDPAIREIIRYLHVHFSDPSLTVEAVMTKYPMSRSDRDQFKSEMKVGLKEYIIRLRMDKAKKLIENGIGNLESITRAVGYGDDYHYFSRLFKEKDEQHRTFSEYKAACSCAAKLKRRSAKKSN